MNLSRRWKNGRTKISNQVDFAIQKRHKTCKKTTLQNWRITKSCLFTCKRSSSRWKIPRPWAWGKLEKSPWMSHKTGLAFNLGFIKTLKTAESRSWAQAYLDQTYLSDKRWCADSWAFAHRNSFRLVQKITQMSIFDKNCNLSFILVSTKQSLLCLIPRCLHSKLV